jgi:hypothetical protein
MSSAICLPRPGSGRTPARGVLQGQANSRLIQVPRSGAAVMEMRVHSSDMRPQRGRLEEAVLIPCCRASVGFCPETTAGYDFGVQRKLPGAEQSLHDIPASRGGRTTCTTAARPPCRAAGSCAGRPAPGTCKRTFSPREHRAPGSARFRYDHSSAAGVRCSLGDQQRLGAVAAGAQELHHVAVAARLQHCHLRGMVQSCSLTAADNNVCGVCMLVLLCSAPPS